MHLSKTDNQITYPILVDRDYYIARVGRCLEVRCKQTHAVLQVLEPPREWGENWLWSSCGFDGTICVPLDVVRFIRNDSLTAFRRPSDTAASRPARPAPASAEIEPGAIGRIESEHPGQGRQQHRAMRSATHSDTTFRLGTCHYGDDEARSSSRIHAGVSAM